MLASIRSTIFAAIASLSLPALASAADPILKIDSPSLTTYLYNAGSGRTRVQDARPLAEQRGANLDGTQRLGGSYPWSFAANLFESAQPGETFGAVRLSTGNYTTSQVDLTFPAEVPWVVMRTYNFVQKSNGESPAHFDSNGPQGLNWFQGSQMEIRFYEQSSGQKTQGDMIYLVYGNDRYASYVRTGTDHNTFRGVNGAAGVFVFTSGSPDQYVYYGPYGDRAYFFGGNASTTGHDASWQVWKLVNAAGRAAYVGHETSASSAISQGYDAGGRIQVAYDSAGRRYCYSYTTIDSVTRLTQVLAETQTGEVWGECGEATLVGKVEYAYYHTGDTTNGLSGNLKLVTITTPLSNPVEAITRRRYYRYITASTSQNALVLAVAEEGIRRYTSGDTSDTSFNGSGVSISDLSSYADAVLTYGSDGRVATARFDGECACTGSGGIDGLYTLHYDPHSESNPDWDHRVVIEPPSGGAWATQYFDLYGEAMSRVLTDVNPTTDSAKHWITKVIRNSDHQIVEVHTPANCINAQYYHGTGVSGHNQGDIGTSSSAGLVYLYDRVTSTSDAEWGFLHAVRQANGDGSLSSNAKYLSRTTYTEHGLDLSTATLYRPMVDSARLYNAAATAETTGADYNETTYSYPAWWSTTTTNVQFLAPTQITTTSPGVDASHNGPGTSYPTSTDRFLRANGTTAFYKSARGVYAYTKISEGQLVQRIEDARTDGGVSYDTGETPSTFGISSGSSTWLHRITEYSFDAQGRLSGSVVPSATLAGGERTTLNWYTRLGDDRFVAFGIPLVRTGESMTAYSWEGPTTYTVTNQSGSVEDCMIIALAGGGPKYHPGGGSTGNDYGNAWITTRDADESDASTPYLPSDPLEALNPVDPPGPVARITESTYNNTGRKLEERRVFFSIPTTLTGDQSASFDRWKIEYDHMGRQVRVTDPTTTISGTAYDALGRVTARSIGTDAALMTSNMTVVESDQFDGGNDGGNSLLTQRTLNVVDGSSGARVTNYVFDYRGRVITVLGPLAPYSVTAYDNRNRVTATALYNSSSGLDQNSQPSTSTNRVALSESFYDERGQVWKTLRHNIAQATAGGVTLGDDVDSLDSLNWYDPDGALVLTQGEQFMKFRRDRLGRQIQRFKLATLSSGSYADVYDGTSTKLWVKVGSDNVLEELQTHYDITDHPKMQGVISRLHDDTTTTGALDSTYDGGDGLADTYTGSNINGRLQLTVYRYDDYERPIQTEFYGTGDATRNAPASSFAFPSSSTSDALVTQTFYDDDGSVLKTVSAAGTAVEAATKYEYDAAGRCVATIANWTGSTSGGDTRDHDLYTRYEYTHGLQTKIRVDLNGDGSNSADQVTEYVYGTPKGTAGTGTTLDNRQSAIATWNLLHHVIYPSGTFSTADDRKVVYCYNAQGQLAWVRDQAGNITETAYDTRGRESARIFSTIATGFDGRVKSIATSYLARGLVDTVKQFDGTTPTPVCVGAVEYGYDGWGNLASFDQDVDSDFGVSGRATAGTSYAYAKATGGRHTVRRTSTTLPGSRTLTYTYSSAGGKLDDAASRVTRVYRMDFYGGGLGVWLITYMAQYEYLGVSQLVGTDLLEAQARWNQFEGATGTNPYPDLDRYNRVQASRWTGYKVTGTRDFYDVHLAYDEASSIVSSKDSVIVEDATGHRKEDALYAMDGLRRLLESHEGELNTGGTAISYSYRDEQWKDGSGNPALSQTGNWLRHRLDLTGGTSFTDLDDTGTFNKANELSSRDTHSDTSFVLTLSYDACGNQTSDGERTYKYDPMGHLTQIKDTGSGNVLAEYQYNALGFMTKRLVDTNWDGAADGSDVPEWLCYDDQWRKVSLWHGTDADPFQKWGYHTAGLGGYGGSSYVDSTLYTERDTSPLFTFSDQLCYFCQNWRSDVVAMLDSAGNWLDNVRYSAYGVPRSLAGDANGDGVANDDDFVTVAGWAGLDHVLGDLTLDGTIDWDDAVAEYVIESCAWGLPQEGRLSFAPEDNRKGYAGYEWEPMLEGAGKAFYHVRYREYDAGVGRWTKRDPLGMSRAIPSLYEYCGDDPEKWVDPAGLQEIETKPGRVRPRQPSRWRPGRGPHRRWMPPEREENPDSLPAPWDPGIDGRSPEDELRDNDPFYKPHNPWDSPIPSMCSQPGHEVGPAPPVPNPTPQLVPVIPPPSEDVPEWPRDRCDQLESEYKSACNVTKCTQNDTCSELCAKRLQWQECWLKRGLYQMKCVVRGREPGRDERHDKETENAGKNYLKCMEQIMGGDNGLELWLWNKPPKCNCDSPGTPVIHGA